MMGNHLVSTIRDTQLYLFQTIPHSTYLPFPILDLLGAIRLSIFVDQYVRSKSKIPDDKVDEGGRRPTFLQEAFGIAVLVFGGETFLAAFLGTLPSWLQSPNGIILFCGMHYLISRTPLNTFIPRTPVLAHEFPLSFHDSLGRALVLTTFSFDLIKSHKDPLIASNPYLMVLSAWIMTAPFASATFAFGLLEKEWKFTTPPELKPGGWLAVDFWAPIVIASLYGALTHAHPMFLMPFNVLRSFLPGTDPALATKSTPFTAWSSLDARAFCAIMLTALFACRSIYNFGGALSVPAWEDERKSSKLLSLPSGPSSTPKRGEKAQ